MGEVVSAEDKPAMPRQLVPMKAKLGGLPSHDSEWAFEVKWDGVRALIYSDSDNLRVQSRNLRDITSSFPELIGLRAALKNRPAILDGEIIAPLDTGYASFERLQGRLGSVDGNKMETISIIYMIFDLLNLDGRSTLELPYIERRRLLDQLDLDGSFWRPSEYHIGDGGILLEAARERGLEGIVAKRINSQYEPGKRTGAWLKIKLRQGQELVIGGWSEGKNGRGEIGSLMVGYYDISSEQARRLGRSQQLIYAGNVGTGFSAAELTELGRRLAPLQRDADPFSDGTGHGRQKRSFFVDPKLVGEFEFTEWTRSGILRQPSFKGLRFDKDPHEVVREDVG